GHPAAAEEVDRVGVGDDVAPPVRGDDVVGVHPLGRQRLPGGGTAAAVVGRVRVTGGHRRGQRGAADQAAAGGGERRVEQAAQRHVHVTGIADVGVAVGE